MSYTNRNILRIPETTVTQEITSISPPINAPFSTAYLRARTTNGYDANTKLLMYFEGADASTTFIDQTGKTVVASGNAQHDTAQKRWGTSAGLLDGTGDYWTISDLNNELDFGTSDFTIEIWKRFNSVASFQGLVDFRQADNNEVAPFIYLDGDDKKIKYFVSNSARITSSTVCVTNVWYHIAIVRLSGSTKLYINGVQEGSTYTDANDYIDVTSIKIGAYWSNILTFNGRTDECRISNSARYTTTFTPSGLNLLSSNKMRVLSVGKNIAPPLSDYYSIAAGVTIVSESAIKIIGDGAYNNWVSKPMRINPSSLISLSFTSDRSDGLGYITWLDINGNAIDNSLATMVIGRCYNNTTSPANATYMKVTLDGRNTTNTFNYSDLQVEYGADDTTYEPYKSTSAIVDTVGNSVSDTIFDKVGLLTGRKEQNVSALTSISDTDYEDIAVKTNVDIVYTTATVLSGIIGQSGSGVQGIARVYNSSNKELVEMAYTAEPALTDVGKYYFSADNRVYFVVTKGLYANIGDARTGLGTSNIVYQLAEPIITNGYPNVLESYPSGTVMVLPQIEDKGIYGTNLAITDTDFPISSLVKVWKVNTDDTTTPIDISDCTVAVGGLTFTVSGASAGDYYKYIYAYVGLSSTPSLTYAYNINDVGQADSSVKTLGELQQKIDYVISNTEPTIITLPISKGGTNTTSFTSSQLVRMNSGGTALESSGVIINDSGTTTSDLWTASKIQTAINAGSGSTEAVKIMQLGGVGGY